MTTHQIAELFDSLRTGLGVSLRSDAAKGFEEAASTFRELPDQPLKQLMTAVQKAREGTPAKKAKHAVDIGSLIDRIRLAQAGTEPAAPLLNELEGLNNPQLKTVLEAFGLKGTTQKAKNLERVRPLVANGSNGQPSTPPIPSSEALDLTQVESAVRLFQELKSDPEVTIPEVRARLEPIRHYPKAVVVEISRRLGYTPDDSREKTFERMLSNLEGIKMSQLRSKMILNN